MKGYKHLTAHDRNKMAKMRKEGATMRQIGAALLILGVCTGILLSVSAESKH